MKSRTYIYDVTFTNSLLRLHIDTYKIIQYNLVMFSTKVYTPEQVAELLQLSKNTVYKLIDRGEIVAKRIGNTYRIPSQSISFVFTGLDFDLYSAEHQDRKNLDDVTSLLKKARKSL